MAEFKAAAGRRLLELVETSTTDPGAPRGRRPTIHDHDVVDPSNLLGGRGVAGDREDFATSATGEFQNKSAYVIDS